MSRTKILVIILLFSVAFAAYTYWPLYSLYFPRTEIEAPETVADEKIETEQAAATSEVEPKKKTAAKSKKEIRLVDPFSLRIAARTKAEIEEAKKKWEEAKKEQENKKKIVPLRLEGVWISPKLRIAFISGQALPLGGLVRGWTVARIFSSQVLLVKNRSSKILELEEE
jgi:hypothetical protein